MRYNIRLFKAIKGCILILFMVFALLMIREIGRISFSHEPGFYSEPFELKILNIPFGCDVYYTLDGSEPTKEDILYKEGLQVKDVTNTNNTISNRKDVSLAFFPDFLSQNSVVDYPKYRVPVEPVAKGMVIRAQCYWGNNKIGDEIQGSYFVGYDSREGWDNIGIVSLIVEPDDFFSYDRGIYVLGKKFDEYQNLDVWGQDPFWWGWSANYKIKGEEWCRNAVFQYFDEKKNLQVNKQTVVNVKGGSSRALIPKSMKLYSKEGFKYDFWRKGYNAKRLILFSGSNDYNTKLRDKIISERIEEYQMAKTHFLPVAVFLNGEYWGFYYITEDFDEEFFNYYYGLEGQDVVVLKNNAVEIGTEEDLNEYNQIVSFATQNDMSLDSNYERINSLIDVEGFAEYMALNIYISRTGDWPDGNIGIWKTKKVHKGFADGRWRWILFDLNSNTCRLDCVQLDGIENARSKNALFDSLWYSKRFRDVFYKKIHLVYETFEAKKMSELINAQIAINNPQMQINNERYFNRENYADNIFAEEDVDTTEKAYENFIDFFKQRKDILQEIEKMYEVDDRIVFDDSFEMYKSYAKGIYYDGGLFSWLSDDSSFYLKKDDARNVVLYCSTSDWKDRIKLSVKINDQEVGDYYVEGLDNVIVIPVTSEAEEYKIEIYSEDYIIPAEIDNQSQDTRKLLCKLQEIRLD